MSLFWFDQHKQKLLLTATNNNINYNNNNNNFLLVVVKLHLVFIAFALFMLILNLFTFVHLCLLRTSCLCLEKILREFGLEVAVSSLRISFQSFHSSILPSVASRDLRKKVKEPVCRLPR
ncbi:hypothetical protein HELRODRAFT_167003 [Helobdella robusta]|uniref:Uncharacterized protein n=1 Tax=Helobdella robusta TaxID=6412 RepID=T1EYV7_HELRO|nr:hypothetical protein HELRODRAFT_167003 [Helobdella robusta]ESO11910.1 hypothetical protein HELRODRAFT_167003 [Helobdella robusta]